MLAAHISTASRLHSLDGPPASLPEILPLAQKYTRLPGADADARVWIARLDAEKRLVGSDEAERARIGKIWTEARARVRGEGVVDVWVWGVQDAESYVEQRILLDVSAR